ncbi:MAG: tripartite tricarboxylate transporter substrate binding protein [Betaproteobacteria bacterium]|nr:tripartite tricarboxylate transporter substrate binding protein [Betaproteobacteria bacterium]
MSNQLRWVAAIALCAVQGLAWAQSWPSKPVRVVVPLSAGSNADILARMVAGRLAAQLGQTFIVENRTGGAGVIGVGYVAKSEPDGYTVLVHTSSFTVTPVTNSNLPYDTARDFAGITPLGVVPLVMIIAPSKGLRTVQEVVAAAKAKPGSMNYASAGSAGQLSSERFRISAGFEGVHIPFKGTPEAVTEVLTGRVDTYFCPVTPCLSYIKEGKLLALAASSSKRSSVLPDVPTTLEAGFPNSNYNFWTGMFVPAKTPRNVVDKLYQETVKALQTAEVRERLTKLGTEPMPLTPEQFDKLIREELAANAALVKAAGIQGN